MGHRSSSGSSSRSSTRRRRRSRSSRSSRTRSRSRGRGGVDPRYREIQQLVLKRQEARRARDFPEADRIRDELRLLQVNLDDDSHTWTADGLCGTYSGRVSSPPKTAIDPELQGMVQTIKRQQRTEEDYKRAWVDYCHKYGNGSLDPQRHTLEFLVKAHEACEESVRTGVPIAPPPRRRSRSRSRGRRRRRRSSSRSSAPSRRRSRSRSRKRRRSRSRSRSRRRRSRSPSHSRRRSRSRHRGGARQPDEREMKKWWDQMLAWQQSMMGAQRHGQSGHSRSSSRSSSRSHGRRRKKDKKDKDKKKKKKKKKKKHSSSSGSS